MVWRHLVCALSLVAALSAVACSSGGRTLPVANTPAAPGNSPGSMSFIGTGPYTPSHHAALPPAKLPNQAGNSLTPALSQLASRLIEPGIQSYSNNNDLEQVGVFTNPGGFYSATFAYVALYPVSKIQIAYPAGSTDTSAIYESLTANNGGCLGNFLTYINAGTGTQAVYSVYNYCGSSPGIVFQTPVDSNFINNYATQDSSGVPLIGTEVFTYDLTPNANSVWYSVLDNNVTGQHEFVAQATGVLSSRTTGFVLWTSELQPQPCPNIPTMGAESIVMWDNQANSWAYVTPQMAATTSTLATPASSYGCFNDQPTLGPITEYAIPFHPVQYNLFPVGITTGPDGNEWFILFQPDIGKSTPSGSMTEYALPSLDQPTAITTGADGNLWISVYNEAGYRIDKVNTSASVTEYLLPSQSIFFSDANLGITTGPDGNVWFTEQDANKVGKITPSGTITEYQLPFLPAGGGLPPTPEKPLGIVAGPDGNLWFTEWLADKIGKITTSGQLTEYTIPPDGDREEPYWIAAGADGNLWFTQQDGHIGKITTAGVITEYAVPTPNSNPVEIAAGSDGNLWFTEDATNKIGKIAISGTITEYPAPSLASYQFNDVTSNYHWLIAPTNSQNGPWGIAPGPNGSGTVWFTDQAANRLGKITLH